MSDQTILLDGQVLPAFSPSSRNNYLHVVINFISKKVLGLVNIDEFRVYVYEIIRKVQPLRCFQLR